MNILHLDSSARDGDESVSRRLSAEIVRQLKGKHPDAEIVRRDVEQDRLPHVDTRIRAAWSPDVDEVPGASDVLAISRPLVEELKAADIVVIGAPMYNFTVPSTLKAWIDHVAVAGQTFKYTEQGPEGLLATRKAYLALSSGGVYSEGPAAPMEHLGTYLSTVMGFLGIEDVSIVRAEGLAMGPEKAEMAVTDAMERIAEVV